MKVLFGMFAACCTLNSAAWHGPHEDEIEVHVGSGPQSACRLSPIAVKNEVFTGDFRA